MSTPVSTYVGPEISDTKYLVIPSNLHVIIVHSFNALKFSKDQPWLPSSQNPHLFLHPIDLVLSSLISEYIVIFSIEIVRSHTDNSYIISSNEIQTQHNLDKRYT